MAKTVGELVGKIRNTEKVFTDPSLTRLRKAGTAARQAFLGAPGAPHRVAGKATGVRVRAIGEGVSVRWTGPAHLVNNPTKPHDIRPRKFVGTRGTGKRAQKGAALLSFFGVDARAGQGGLKLADGQIRSTVHHPGTRGKHFFEKGRDRAVPLATKTYQQEFRNDIGKALRG